LLLAARSNATYTPHVPSHHKKKKTKQQ